MNNNSTLNNTLYVGDCLKIMKQLSSESVNLTIVDPPYNIGYDYDCYSDTKTSTDYMHWSQCWFDEVYRLLKNDGAMWLIIGDSYVSELDTMIKKCMTRRNWCIWHYTFGNNQRKKFTPSHVHLLYYVKNEKQCVWNSDAVAVPSARQTKYNDIRGIAGGKSPDDVWILNPKLVDSDTLWVESRICGTFRERVNHPAQLPEAIVERIIRCSSNVGQTVFDPMAGSGTVAAVAIREERMFIGCELSWNYSQIIGRRCGDGLELITNY